jgi:UDP-GlcNAc:undecaprenyl-phosphate GlcNAc-1-phosphate transferase
VTTERLVQLLILAAAGGLLSFLTAAFTLPRSSEKVVRVNVNGRQVPAILGVAIVGAGLVVGAVALILFAELGLRLLVGVLVPIVLLFSAGFWDDLRGAEHARGFAGHLEAARARRLTGGAVKAVAGFLAGLCAGLVLTSGWGVVQFALLVPLAANFVNLTDRVPGRAGKVSLAIGLPLLALGHPDWAALGAGFMGALAAVLPLDLGEKAMLGDAGANPLGGILGLGLAWSLQPAWGWVALGVLLALNLASERWSYSTIVARVGPLNWLDGLGRK